MKKNAARSWRRGSVTEASSALSVPSAGVGPERRWKEAAARFPATTLELVAAVPCVPVQMRAERPLHIMPVDCVDVGDAPVIGNAVQFEQLDLIIDLKAAMRELRRSREGVRWLRRAEVRLPLAAHKIGSLLQICEPRRGKARYRGRV
jgi:hypothetical protein